MSRIEDVLKKMQANDAAVQRAEQVEAPATSASQAAAPSGFAATISQPVSTTARSTASTGKRRKIVIEGEKHHVEWDDLVKGRVLAPQEKTEAVAEEFRRIKRPLIANALRMGPDAPPNKNVIMIASGLPGAGKSFCSVNLAVSMSLERELNILLVDGDIPKPHISRVFGLSKAPGLIDLLFDESASVEDVLVRTDLNNIQVLPAGTQHPQATELLASERMSVIVAELAARYPDRLILLDSPPLLITTEAQALASQVGQVAVVVEAGRTTEHALTQTLATLDPVKAINIILNKARHMGQASYYYGDGYGYGSYGYRKRPV